jgi:hypothetical protein
MTIARRLLAAAGCESERAPSDAPAPAKEEKPEAKKPEAQTGDQATKPAKGETEDAKVLGERTTKLMEALRAKNADGIAELAPEGERAEVKKAFAADGKAYKSFFAAEEWRAKAIAAWDGKVRAIRMKDDEARVSIGETDKKEVVVVSWVREKGQWYFKDMLSPAADAYAAWGVESK